MVASFLASAGVVAFGVGIVTLISVAILIELLQRGWSLAWRAMDWMLGTKPYSARSFVRQSAVSSLD